LGLDVLPSQVNYLMARLPESGPSAAQVAAACAAQGVLVRDCASFAGCKPYHLRVAVADPTKQDVLLAALSQALG
jgi:histidinol-phosphate/aromatic aminotransferase/cobyric acid decarboxylase-like protein